MSSNVTEQTNAIATTLLEEATQKTAISVAIDSLYEEIIENSPKATIPEIVFAQHYVPLLAAYVTGNGDKKSSVLAEWVSIAGTPYNEVDIVDKDGTVIETIPAIMAKPVSGAPLNKMSVMDITAEFEKRSNAVPELGVKYLEANLKQIGDNVKATTDEPAIKWGKLFKKYLSVGDTPTVKKEVKMATKKHDDKIIIDYD